MELTKEFLNAHKSISNVSLTIEFEPIEQVQRNIYQFETDFKKLFPDEAIDTRVPLNYNPSTPRFILRDDKKKRYLEVSQDNAVLKNILTEGHATDIQSGLDYFKKQCEFTIQHIQKLLVPNIFKLNISIQLQYSLKDFRQKEISQFYYDRFLNHQNIASPETFTFTIHYKENDRNLVSLHFEEYHSLRFKIPPRKDGGSTTRPNTFLRFKIDSPAVEVLDNGLRINIGVDNGLDVPVDEFDQTPLKSLDGIFGTVLSKIQGMEDFLL